MRSTGVSASLLLSLSLLSRPVLGQSITSINDLAAQWNLNAAEFSFKMPGETLNSQEAQSWITKNWDLANRIDWGGNDIVFSPDPSTSSSTLVRREPSTATSSPTTSVIQPVSSPASTNLGGESPVLRINYPQGSYSKRTGGTQFYAVPLNASGQDTVQGNSSTDGQYERMLLAYDVWFPEGYAWNMGGKLPGMKGGPNEYGCSGGNETDGTTCFSTRLMWRTGGAGEVYAYIPTSQKNFCSQSNIICNSDYGTSLARGSFSFATGQWQTIYLLVVLNHVGTANGVVQLYYNGVPAMSFENLILRTSSGIASIGGLFFSTFFGGDDTTWATPTSQYTYFKNMQLYAGYGAANGTGDAVGAATKAVPGWGLMGGLAVALSMIVGGILSV